MIDFVQYDFVHKTLARLIVAFLGVALLLPGGKRLQPEIRLLEPVTTESTYLHYEVSNEAGWYFNVEYYTLEREENGEWQNVPLNVGHEEIAVVFSLVPLLGLVRHGQSFEKYIHFSSVLGHPVEAGHYRMHVMQDYFDPVELAALEFDITQAS